MRLTASARLIPLSSASQGASHPTLIGNSKYRFSCVILVFIV